LGSPVTKEPVYPIGLGSEGMLAVFVADWMAMLMYAET
jgi:hypothetical protein